MPCSTGNKPPVPASDSLEIVSHIGKTFLSTEVAKVAENLKKAGVTEVSIESSIDGDEIRVRPIGGNNDEVRPVLSRLRDILADEGVPSTELTLFNCNNRNGPWYLLFRKQDIER